ncbi:MAG: C40 family peptidase [Deltaproteobacteria bacterium]|nr:C40 family peptidase [Deltaproteobacteria bacterium]
MAALGSWGRILAAVLIIGVPALGCTRPPVPPAGPPPTVWRTPQETALHQALQEFYGSPYKPGGTDPSGVDCSGLVQAVFQRVGVALPRTVAQQFRQGQPVPRARLRFGDVVFFNRFCQARNYRLFRAGLLAPASAARVCHNGIYLGRGRFIHASRQGVYVSRLDAPVWQASFMGARRYLPP